MKNYLTTIQPEYLFHEELPYHNTTRVLSHVNFTFKMKHSGMSSDKDQVFAMSNYSIAHL